MRSLMAERRREDHFDAENQGRILATFEGDIAAGHLILLPHTLESFLLAESLMGAHPDVPLTSLDALHLGVMRLAGATVLATADRVMARAAAALGMECRVFFQKRRGQSSIAGGVSGRRTAVSLMRSS